MYAIFLVTDIFPVGQPISADDINKLMQGDTQALPALFKVGNILYFASQLLIFLITSFIGLIYANCYIMQHESFPSKKAVVSALRALPKLLGFLILLIAPLALSSIFAFIPMIFLVYALFFVPLLIMESKKSIVESIIASFKATKGIKFNIFITQMMIYFIMNLPISLFSSAFYYVGASNTLSEYLVLSFLRAAYVLMGGRLAGNFYLLVFKNEEKDKKIRFDLFLSKNEINHDTEKNSEEDFGEDKDEEVDKENSENSENSENEEKSENEKNQKGKNT